MSYVRTNLYPSGVHYKILLYFSFCLSFYGGFQMVCSVFFLFVWCPFKVYDLLNIFISFMKPQIRKQYLIDFQTVWLEPNQFSKLNKQNTHIVHIDGCNQMNNDNSFMNQPNQLSVINRLDENGLPHNNIPSFIGRSESKRRNNTNKIRFALFSNNEIEMIIIKWSRYYPIELNNRTHQMVKCFSTH